MGLKCLLATVGSTFILILSLSSVVAEPATLPFTDCFSGDASRKVQISTVYGQTLSDRYLNLTIIANTPVEIVSASNNTNEPVATTLFTTTDQLTFNVWNNGSYFCATLRPQSPLPSLDADSDNTYCPLTPGPFAFSTVSRFPEAYELATFNTRLRVLDPDQNEMLCVDVPVTPLKPNRESVYGTARVILYGSAAIAVAYWLLVGMARVVSAWDRGLASPGIWRRVESAGFIFASALSGERLANSPALLRFCTPSLRDIVFHSQWCASLGMVAVRWPQFVYPLLSQTAWSMLSYNVTITGNSPEDHYDPLTVQPYDPPSNFVDQLNDSSSPLFIDPSAPNTFFTLPSGVTTGIPAFAAAVGIPPTRLFSITMILFLGLCGAAVVLSVVVWAVDRLATFIGRAVGYVRTTPSNFGTRSPHFGSSSKDAADKAQSPVPQADENRSLNGHIALKRSRFQSASRWRNISAGFGSLHGSVLQGNLVRLLVLFHFPVTVASCYQMTLTKESSAGTIALAALSFVFLSVALPVFLVFRLYVTNTSKLYDETWTLLALGPLYNHYRHGSQLFACLLFATNIAFALTIGCGQKSGTAQAIIILLIEVISALGTSFWLPWGHGASMGLISFLFCVARIVIAVLMVILAPIVSIGAGAGQWVAYAILIILGLVYLAFVLMLIVKLVEAVVRIFGGVGFHRTRHVVDSGLYGACGLAGWCGSRPRRRPRRQGRHRPSGSGSGSGPALRLGSSQISLSKPGPQSLPTPSSSAPPSVLRPEHALQPYREESDEEDGYIMGAWHSYTKPGYSAVNDQMLADPAPPPQKSSGFMRVGGGRAHFDTPYAIQSDSKASLDRQSTTLNPAITPPQLEHNRPPSSSKLSTSSSTMNTPSVGILRSSGNNKSRPTSSGSGGGGGNPPPSIIGRTTGRQNLPHGAMPPAHFRIQSQSAIVVNPGLADHPPGPPGSGGPGNETSIHNALGKIPSPMRTPPIRYASEDDGSLDSGSATPRKKPWYRALRSKGYSDGSAPADEETGPSTGPSGGGAPGRSFVVVRKTQGQGQGHRSRPSTAGSPDDDAGQTKGSFVVLRGQDAQSDDGHGGRPS